jgi:type II secretory pathway pseudopilin PulG
MIRARRAFSILEAIVALALFLLLVSALGAYSSLGLGQLSDRQKLIAAEISSQEALTLVSLVAKRDWSLLNTNVSSLSYDNGLWNLVADDYEQIGDYQRSVILENICRNAQSLVVDCPDGIIDTDVYKLTVIVKWFGSRGQQNLEKVFYLTKALVI